MHVRAGLIEMYKSVNDFDEMNWESGSMVNTPQFRESLQDQMGLK